MLGELDTPTKAPEVPEKNRHGSGFSVMNASFAKQRSPTQLNIPPACPPRTGFPVNSGTAWEIFTLFRGTRMFGLIPLCLILANIFEG